MTEIILYGIILWRWRSPQPARSASMYMRNRSQRIFFWRSGLPRFFASLRSPFLWPVYTPASTAEIPGARGLKLPLLRRSWRRFHQLPGPLRLILFPSAITNSVSVLLLPIVSEADAGGNKNAVRRAIFTSIRLCLLLGFFFTALFLVFGDGGGEQN